MYDGNTPIPFGKHRFTLLKNVPAQYLLDLLSQKNNKDVNKDVMEYIEQNLHFIKSKLGSTEPVEETKLCDKIAYPTENDAKKHIREIRKLEQKHKKPVRSYECEKCGGWHLTSIPLGEWKPQLENKY
jgi:hypothetical protein